MKRIGLIVTAVFALGLAASPALATDLCVKSFSSRFVGKGFTVPSRNKCKPFNGFVAPGVFDGSLAVGTGCTTADGSLLRLHLTFHAADNNVFNSMACNFVLPAMTTGNCRFKEISQNQFIFDELDSAATAARCTAVEANVP